MRAWGSIVNFIERRRVFYRGRVQGVGFRATVRQLAKGFRVAGWVRNLADGRVELLAEGSPSELSSFIDAVAREFDRQIQGVDDSSEPADLAEPLADFVIRF